MRLTTHYTPVSLYYVPNIASERQISSFLLKISRFKNKFNTVKPLLTGDLT